MSYLKKEAEEDQMSRPGRKQSQQEQGTHLKPQLHLLDGASIIVGIIVGSGIFVSPKGVLIYSGSVGLALVVWVLSGLFCMVGALCYAELGTMIPRSGGDYAYIGTAFGSLPAFLYLWSALLVIMPAGNAITALTFGYYVLQPFYPECDAPLDAVRMVAAALVCVLTAVNCHNVRSVARVQDVFTAAKVLALLIIIAAGLIWLGSGHTEYLAHPGDGSNFSPGNIALAFYSGLFSYAGWNYLNFVTEELRDPNKNLPRAIYISLPTVVTIYLLTNLAYFAVLDRQEILASNAVAVTFGIKLLGRWFSWLMPAFVACSTLGAVNGGIFASSRLFFVGARYGHMPRALALLNVAHLTPVPCLVFLAIITLAMLSSDNVYDLINYTSFIESLFQLVSVAGLLYLRWQSPELPRPIRVHLLFPILFFIVCSFLVLFPAYESPTLVAVDLIILAAGVVVYFLCVAWKDKPVVIRRTLHSIDRTIQKLFLSVPED